MTDNVIEFKPKTENEDVYFGIVNDGVITNTGVIDVSGYTHAKQYLLRCKNELEDEDYRDVLCGIMDVEIYNELEEDLQKIVETYYSWDRTDLNR